MEFKLPNGEFRYIPKVIYKYIFTREQLLYDENMSTESWIKSYIEDKKIKRKEKDIVKSDTIIALIYKVDA